MDPHAPAAPTRPLHRLPMLANVKVASPCDASWDEMEGDERVRFCVLCEQKVYNLSGMTRDEAEALLLGSRARLCVRFYQRADGTVITRDCTVGARKRRRRIAAASVASVFAMLAVACGGDVDGPNVVPPSAAPTASAARGPAVLGDVGPTPMTTGSSRTEAKAPTPSPEVAPRLSPANRVPSVPPTKPLPHATKTMGRMVSTPRPASR